MVRSGVAGISQLTGVIFGVVIGALAVYFYGNIHLAVTGQALGFVRANELALSHWRGALNKTSPYAEGE